MLRFLKSLWRDRQGVAATEFALIAPALIILFYGTFEASRFLLISQKAEKLAFASSDVIAQSSTVTTAELNAMLDATVHVMNPYAFGPSGVVIVSSIYRAPGSTNPTIAWQRKGGGTLNKNSLLGTQGSRPTLPTGLTLAERDNIIVAEVYYNFVPLFTGAVFAPSTIYQRAFFKPRLGALNTAPG